MWVVVIQPIKKVVQFGQLILSKRFVYFLGLWTGGEN